MCVDIQLYPRFIYRRTKLWPYPEKLSRAWSCFVFPQMTFGGGSGSETVKFYLSPTLLAIILKNYGGFWLSRWHRHQIDKTLQIPNIQGTETCPSILCNNMRRFPEQDQNKTRNLSKCKQWSIAILRNLLNLGGWLFVTCACRGENKRIGAAHLHTNMDATARLVEQLAAAAAGGEGRAQHQGSRATHNWGLRDYTE